MKWFVALFACLFVVCFATEPKPMHLVFDVSGSMWGRVHDGQSESGRMKIEVAREALATLLQTWDKQQPLGFTAYGHRRKGDCDDIETLVPTGPTDVARLLALVKTLQPKGKTPLAAAVRHAAEESGYQQRPATIVLLSDGIETCADDPCALIKDLAAKGTDLTLHVIGFDVTPKDAEQLHCLAAAGGGSYFAAADAAQLADALTEVVAIEAAAAEPEKLGDATVTAPARIEAGAPFEAAWTGPGNRGDRLMVQTPEQAPGARPSDTAFVHRGSPVTLRAPDTPGAYQVRYVTGRSRQALAFAAIEVVPVRAELEVPASVTAGAMVAVQWRGPGNSGERIAIFKPGDLAGGKAISGSYAQRSPVNLRAPGTAGDYEVHYLTARTKESLGSTTLHVEPASVSLSAAERYVAGEDVIVSFEGGGARGDRILWYGPLDGEAVVGEGRYANPKKGEVKLRGPVQPGRYEIQYHNHEKTVLARLPFDVIEGAVSVTGPFIESVGARIEVTWRGPAGSGDRLQVTAVKDGAHWQNIYLSADKHVVAVDVPPTPGRYRIAYVNGRSKAVMAEHLLTVQDIDVAWQVPARAPAGGKITLSWQVPSNPSDQIRLIALDGDKEKQVRTLYPKGRTSIDLPLPKEPGRYEVRYLVGAKNRRAVTTAPLIVE